MKPLSLPTWNEFAFIFIAKKQRLNEKTDKNVQNTYMRGITDRGRW
jgi:hypothetical protein